MFMGFPGMATIVDARMVKAKQAQQVLQGKLINLGWQDKSTRILVFESYIISVLLFSCSIWGLTKLDGKGKIGVDCTRELGTLYRFCFRSILNVSHTTWNLILYVLAGKPPLQVYITKAVTQFVEYWSKGNRLVAKVARRP